MKVSVSLKCKRLTSVWTVRAGTTGCDMLTLRITHFSIGSFISVRSVATWLEGLCHSHLEPISHFGRPCWLSFSHKAGQDNIGRCCQTHSTFASLNIQQRIFLRLAWWGKSVSWWDYSPPDWNQKNTKTQAFWLWRLSQSVNATDVSTGQICPETDGLWSSFFPSFWIFCLTVQLNVKETEHRQTFIYVYMQDIGEACFWLFALFTIQEFIWSFFQP